nr:unnamed protein product [Callosobruchus chinensis]
MWNQNHQCCR